MTTGNSKKSNLQKISSLFRRFFTLCLNFNPYYMQGDRSKKNKERRKRASYQIIQITSRIVAIKSLKYAKYNSFKQLIWQKNGIPLYPNLVNLKSNTMKNTLQRYYFLRNTSRISPNYFMKESIFRSFLGIIASNKRKIAQLN